MSENTLVWVDIPVSDLDRAIQFYSAVLAKPVQKQSFGPDFEMALLPDAEDRVSGCLVKLSDRQPSAHGPLIYLNVNGRIEEAVSAVTSSGGQILASTHQIGPHGFRALIADTEGNHLALHSR